ncbi:hypothetical protein PTKU46_80070 [Paraburkholderia terrae]|uniref:hypothetical protein n=1 Tax=Paraburkholderia terrae TaxID=311230 RepID=UPI0030E4AA88
MTAWIEVAANGLLESELNRALRVAVVKALHATTTNPQVFLNAYVSDLGNVSTWT